MVLNQKHQYFNILFDINSRRNNRLFYLTSIQRGTIGCFIWHQFNAEQSVVLFDINSRRNNRLFYLTSIQGGTIGCFIWHQFNAEQSVVFSVVHVPSYSNKHNLYILHLTSYILHLTSYILHLTSYILHLTSYILHTCFSDRCYTSKVSSCGSILFPPVIPFILTCSFIIMLSLFKYTGMYNVIWFNK